MTESKITYLLQEVPKEPLQINMEDSLHQWEFPEVGGRVIVSLWIKPDIHNTGVNVLTLYGTDGEKESVPVFVMDTEGAFFYSYDGTKKCKLGHFESDVWYSVYLSFNCKTGRYSLYVDGEQVLCGQAMTKTFDKVFAVSVGSHGGKMYVKQLFVYKNTIQDVCAVSEEGCIYDAKEMGVSCDGITVETQKLQQLIDKCSEGGGTLYLKEGTYLTGSLTLKKNVTLYIEENAVLKGVLDIDAYPVRLSETHVNWNTSVQGPQKALLYGDSQENIRILGGGCIDGSGDFPGAYGSESLRVSAILLSGCDNVEICDIYVKDAGMWTIPVVECDHLYIHDLNINSTWYPNRDGIDICDCHDVLIENCNIKADDDAMCFKSGHERGCDNVVIRNCMIISTMANGIKFGTYSYGGFTNCLSEDCIIKDTRTCAISIQSVDGGRVENLHFRRIVIQNVESVFFALIADKARISEGYERRIGSIENIFFEDIEASGVRRNYGTYLGGFACEDKIYPIRKFYFKNVNVIYLGGCKECPCEPAEFERQYPESNCFGVLPASGYYIRHAEDIVFEDCETIIALPDIREVFYLSDTKGVCVNGKAYEKAK